MADLDFKEILIKEPFKEITPLAGAPRFYEAGQGLSETTDIMLFRAVPQSEFLRQYYPTGHKIYDETIYPDVYREDPDNPGKFYIQPITRVAFAFQQVIATKQVVHLVGNDIQFELAGKTEDEKEELVKNRLLLDFKQGWLDTNMELQFYEAVNSIKITGDAAIVLYFGKDNKPHAKTLSFLNGDKLYPHYDNEGNLTLFARKYFAYDEDGKANTEFVEIWDEKYLYRAKKSVGTLKDNVKNKIKEIFGLSGYSIYEKKEHGFNTIPIAYFRDKHGACWLPAQSTIEQYELSVSYLCENNKANAFPIFYSKGEGVDIVGDMNGSVKAITVSDPSGEIGYLKHGDVSAAFHTQLTLLYNAIYEQTFAVKPPELKSGDLPGVALKLMYSPAIEKAIHDANELLPFINKLVDLVKYAHGYYIGKQASLLELPINAWIEPYVHQNVAELTNNLAMAVQNKFLSKQTASERFTPYAKNDEIQRIIREEKERAKEEAQIQIDIQKEALKLSQKYNATTNLRHIRTTDKNGNHPNENNWNKWNNK